MRWFGWVVLGWLWAMLASPLLAQQPLISQFKPDLRVYPQFFALAQGIDDDLYLGGTDGVLRYDGGRWHFVAMPLPGAVRALHADVDGRVWTGASDCFGFIVRDATGEERFVDLSSKFEADLKGRRFSDIWRVLVVGDEVWFQALHDVFVVSRSGERRAYWHHEGRFGALADVDGVVWLQWRGEGLKQRRGESFEMLPGGERFASHLIYNLLPRGDGRVLVHDVAPSLWQWQERQFHDLTTPELARDLADSGYAILVDANQAVFAEADGRVAMLDMLERGEGISAYERTNRSNHLEFIAGLSLRSAQTDSAEIAAFGLFDMQDQQNEIDRLVNLGALIGMVFVAGAAVIGLLIGRQLGRPLEALVTVADGLGDRRRAGVSDTGYPDVDAVLHAMRHSETRLEATIDQLEQSEANARQLVADVAHELRTPLATLVAVSDILADTESATAENRSEAGGIAARSAAHLAALTNDILEMSRFDSGKSEVVRNPVDLTEMWQQLSELRNWEGVTFELVGEPVVHTDAVRLRLILSNLVTNALRHGEPPVEVVARVTADRLTLTVADSGQGVAPEHVDQVFNRFYKASAARTNSESSGLGLAIVRENARILGGDAWLEQDPWTLFGVWIPLAG